MLYEIGYCSISVDDQPVLTADALKYLMVFRNQVSNLINDTTPLLSKLVGILITNLHI